MLRELTLACFLTCCHRYYRYNLQDFSRSDFLVTLQLNNQGRVAVYMTTDIHDGRLPGPDNYMWSTEQMSAFGVRNQVGLLLWTKMKLLFASTSVGATAYLADCRFGTC
jgi:hypothetical protein